MKRDVDAVTHMWEELQHFLENDAIIFANKVGARVNIARVKQLPHRAIRILCKEVVFAC